MNIKVTHQSSKIKIVASFLAVTIPLIFFKSTFALTHNAQTFQAQDNTATITSTPSSAPTSTSVPLPLPTTRPTGLIPLTDILNNIFASSILGIIYFLITLLLFRTTYFRRLKRWLGFETEISPKPETYSQKLEPLLKNLEKSSSEVDNILTELAQFARDRESAIQNLEANLAKLSERENELQKRVQELSKVSIPAAEHFAVLIAQGDKKSARRDYILAGVSYLLGVITTIVLRQLGLG